ncbi:MAG: hypothetical protein AAGE94_22105 [Acidobacteriota bacterium]
MVARSVPSPRRRGWTWDGDYEASIRPLQRALALAPEPRDRHVTSRSLAFSLEKLRRYDDALGLYEHAGDTASVERVQLHVETLRELDALEIQDGHVCIDFDALDAEAQQLERELDALEEGPGGS